jgi:hypothetical protein
MTNFTKRSIKKEIKSRAKIFRGDSMEKIQKACSNFNYEFEGFEGLVCEIEMELMIASIG